jgi:HAD superfamily hydrolase (TIGR01509 family)
LPFDLFMFAVVFDFDGTILDSETAEYQSHRQLFVDHGLELSEDEWATGVGLLKPDTHWFDRLCARCAEPPTFGRFREVTRIYFRECVPAEPMPGIGALLGALVAAGVPRAVASAAPAEWVVAGLDGLHLTSTFSAIVTGDQVQNLKPAPDVYLEVARRLGMAPDRCVAIEDSGPGIASAHAAGMKTIAIPHPLSRAHDFSGADLQVVSASDLDLETLRALLQSTGA